MNTNTNTNTNTNAPTVATIRTNGCKTPKVTRLASLLWCGWLLSIGCDDYSTRDMDESSRNIQTESPFEDPKGYRFIDGFAEQFCAIKKDGMPECPGMDDGIDALLDGQPHLPVAGYVPSVPLKTLSVGSAFAAPPPACGIREDNSELICWGTGAHPRPFEGEQFQEITVGSSVSCGVLFDGELKCWSWFDEDEQPPERPPPGTLVQDISATQYQVCAILKNGLTQCWGWGSGSHLLDDDSGYTGVTGLGWQSADSLTYLKTDGIDDFEVDISELVGVDARSSPHFGCGITSSGGASCWKVRDAGAGDIASQLVPQPSPLASLFDGPLEQVAAGSHKACGLLETGGIICWPFEE